MRANLPGTAGKLAKYPLIRPSCLLDVLFSLKKLVGFLSFKKEGDLITALYLTEASVELGELLLSCLGPCIAKPQGGGMVSLFFQQQKEVLFNELELTSLLI